MSLFDDQELSTKDRSEKIQKIKKDKEKRAKLKSRPLDQRLKNDGQPVNVEKNFDPIFDRGVITNKTHTWEVELPTEHIGNEHTGALCGRTREGGNIYVSPDKATCKRCIGVYKRARKKNRKLPPLKQNIQPKPKIEESFSTLSAPRAPFGTEELFKTVICAWMMDRPTRVKILGNRKQMRALTNALTAAKAFHQELYSPNADIEKLVTLLSVKTIAAQKFEQVFGMEWPL